MKWIFYAIVFIYMFYRAVYGLKNKDVASIAVEEIKYGNDLHYYPAGVRKTINCKAASKNQKVFVTEPVTEAPTKKSVIDTTLCQTQKFLWEPLLQVEWIDPKGRVVKRVSTNRVFVQEHFVPTSTLRIRVPALVLVLTHAIVEDSGVWECRSGDLKREISLCVIDPSKFVDTPTEVSVDMGRSITLSCQARGEPEPRLLWSRNGELITESLLDSKYRVMTKYNSQGFEGLLTINSLEADDSGVYTCEAIQESPHDASCTNTESFNITLQVNYAPVFANSNDTEIVYQKDDESVDLACSANGFPTPAYTWFRDLGETLFEFPEERVNLQDGKAVLTLPSNLSTSTQRYRCRASNQYGETYKSFAIVKLEPPTKPHKIILQDANHDSVRLNVMWDEEIQFPIKVLDVQFIEKKSLPRRKIETLREADWRKSKSVEIDLEASEEVDADSEGLYFTLTDLEPDLEYWIRLRAVNDAGESSWTEPAYVQTVEEAQTEAPEENEERESTEEDGSESPEKAELAYSDATFYGVFFLGGIVIISVACMFFMRLV